MPNPFAHIELTTDDLKKAKKFYQGVFAWKLNEMPAMAYTMIDVGGGVGGGMQAKPMPEAPTAWLPYVMVDDVKTTIAKAAKLGATVVLPFQEIGEMGSIGIFSDPSGAMLGVWASKAAPPVEAAAKKVAKKAPAKAAAAPAKKAPPATSKKAAASKAPAKAASAKASAPSKQAPAKKGAKKR